MDAWIWVVLAVVVLLIGLVLFILTRRRRSQQLERRFGPEYERELERKGDRRAAEAELMGRAQRRQSLDIRPLSPEARERYSRAWRETQARFVDEPVEAVADAERGVVEVMRERGYPVDDFEQQAADVSVDHPVVVENYRAAHRISTDAGAGRASTEDLRQAMVHYRALFDDLLETADEQRGTRSDTTREVRQ